MPITSTTGQTSLAVPPSTIGLNLPIVNEVGDQSQSMVMSTSFIHQQIDMGINNLMYWMFKQLEKIVKPMVQNEMHNVHKQEQRQQQIGEHYASSFPTSQ